MNKSMNSIIRKILRTSPLYLGGAYTFEENIHKRFLEESLDMSIDTFLENFISRWNRNFSSFKIIRDEYKLDTFSSCFRTLSGLYGICKTYKPVKLSELVESLLNIIDFHNFYTFVCPEIEKRVFTTFSYSSSRYFDEFGMEWDNWTRLLDEIKTIEK